MTKRLSMHRLVRLGVTVAVLACLLFPSVAVKLVHAKPADLGRDVPTQFPCNFDGVISGVGDMLPTGNPGVHDYNLTANWGGTWCDAEKTAADTDDDLMCWAAAASNVLEWTGWGFVHHSIEGEMTNCDQIFEHFNDHWEDQGSLTNIAWMWWFNGIDGLPGDYPTDPPYTGGSAEWSQVDVPGGGDFWDPPYVLSDYYHSYSGPNTLQYINTSLTNGWGVALGIYNGGHAITCWGFRYDNTFNPNTDPDDYYLGLYITDSDNYDLTDQIRYYDVSYNSGISRWEFDTYGGGGWHIEHVFALEKNTFLEPDLAIYKTAYPDVVMAGEELFYNITVVNENTIVGGVTAYNVVVTDTLPIGVTYISDTGGCIHVGGTTYSCNLGDIAPGDSRSFTIKVWVYPDYVVSYGDTITDTATVTSDTQDWESDLTNNEATVTTYVQDEADLNVMKFCKPDTRVLAGELINYTIIVDNLGPSNARNVTIKDTIISSGTFTLISGTSNLPADLWQSLGPHDLTISGLLTDSLGPQTIPHSEHGRWIVWITVRANEAQDINDYVSVFTLPEGTPDPDMSNNQAQNSISVTQEPADLKVIKFVKPDTAVLAGQLINYTIIVENLGPSIAYNVSIRDQILSSGSFQVIGVITDPVRNDAFSYVTPSPGKTIEFNLLEPLEPKNSTGRGRWVLQIILRANETQDIDNVVNVFTRTLRTLDPELSNNEAQCSIHVTAVADLEITKTDKPDPVFTEPADPPSRMTLNYTLVVTNHGPSTAVNVLVEDFLPAGVIINSLRPISDCWNAGVPGDPSRPTRCAIGSLAPGESATIVINVTVLKITYVIVLRNDARVSSDILDPDNSNNFASTDTHAGPSRLLRASIVGENPIGNWYLGLTAIELIVLAGLISSIAGIIIVKRPLVKQSIARVGSFLKAKKQ
jgi:uncharacterized repeat protein (TIGR01451 family)